MKSENEIQYVVGFAFRADEVLLIKKNRPEWQKGQLNGIGGKIESGETPIQCMRREFCEEVGVDIKESLWREFCILRGNNWVVHFFSTLADASKAGQMESEVPMWVSIHPLPKYQKFNNVINNLHWLVPMACANSPVTAIVLEDSDERGENLYL